MGIVQFTPSNHLFIPLRKAAPSPRSRPRIIRGSAIIFVKISCHYPPPHRSPPAVHSGVQASAVCYGFHRRHAGKCWTLTRQRYHRRRWTPLHFVARLRGTVIEVQLGELLCCFLAVGCSSCASQLNSFLFFVFPAIQSAPSLTDGRLILVQNCEARRRKKVNDNHKSMEDERHGTFCVHYCGFLLRIEGEMD